MLPWCKLFEMITFTPRDRSITGIPPRWQHAVAFLLILGLAVLALGANPFRGETVAPLDLLVCHSGWSTAVTPGPRIVHWESTDIIDGVLPFWISLKQQIREGRGSFWNPYFSGGVPVTLDLLNPSFLLFFAIGDNGLALYVIALLKLLVAGSGCYLFVRIFAGWLPALWGAVVFMLCGFNAAWFFWDQVPTAMWIPWLLAATVRYLRSDDRRWLPAITATGWMMITGAFFSVAAFGFYAFATLVVLWAGWDFFDDGGMAEAPRNRRLVEALKKVGWPFLAVGLSFLLAAAMLIPFIDSMAGIDLGYRAGGGTDLSNGFRDLVLFLVPESPLRVERSAYLGPIAVLFAIAGILPALTSPCRDRRKIGVFCAILAVLGIALAFGLLPHALIRTIPVFGFNKWNRFLVIPLFGLSALSAFGVEAFLERSRRFADRLPSIPAGSAKPIAYLVVAGLLAVQFHSQKKLFNAFNAVSPSSWIFPETPNIRYVKDHLLPLQSVIPDRSYGMGGSLGAYSIPVWYAHSFKTEAEKEILDALVQNPFPSPTSCYLEGENIQFNSPLMERLAIRYLLVNKRYFQPPRLVNPVVSNEFAPPLPGNSLSQRISFPGDVRISSVLLRLRASGFDRGPANLRLSIRDREGRQVGPELAVSSGSIASGGWTAFAFPEAIPLKRGTSTLSLSLPPDYSGPGRISAWSTRDDTASGNSLVVNGSPTKTALQMQLLMLAPLDPLLRDDRWKILDLEQEVVILENRRVTGSAYFLKNIAGLASPPDYSGISVKTPSSDRIEIRYSGSGPGWIVLPMRLNSGWTAVVDGAEARYDKYLDMMPAIPVAGACDIVFRYRSSSFRFGVLASGAGVVAFLFFLLACTRHGKKTGGKSDLSEDRSQVHGSSGCRG